MHESGTLPTLAGSHFFYTIKPEVKDMYNSFGYPYTQRQEVTRVNGRPGAEAMQLAPNSSMLLLDESAPIVWLAQTDVAGYKTLTAYDITPHKDPAPADLRSIEDRLKRLEDIIHEQSYFERADAHESDR